MAEVIQNAALLCAGIFACVMLLCGALLLGVGLFALQRYRAAKAWPQVPAVIEASEVVSERRFEDGRFYRPVVRYRYATPSGSFDGDKLSTADRLYPKEEAARRVAARYPAGSTVLARYNPVDPAEAVLERGASGGFGLLLFGLLCWIVPVAAARKAGFSWPLIAGVLGALALLPFLLLLRSRSPLADARRRGLCPPAGSGSDADVAALAARGEKLLAIRLYRELHGGGLKAAREAVERMLRAGRPPAP